jgi:hypothetical protein
VAFQFILKAGTGRIVSLNCGIGQMGSLAMGGLITDLIVGSGWPFGGRFMEEDQIVKDAIQEVLNAENVIKMGAPAESVDLVDWTSGLMRKIQLEPQATKFLISGYRLK